MGRFKNIQRQKGLLLSKDYNFILDELHNKNSKFIIIQKLLQNPLLINKRKINLRVYFLIICKGKSKKGYIYKDGFIYYTRKFYKKNELHFDYHITTGYIDRSVYKTNPLTHSDLYKFLGKKKRYLIKKKM